MNKSTPRLVQISDAIPKVSKIEKVLKLSPDELLAKAIRDLIKRDGLN